MYDEIYILLENFTKEDVLFFRENYLLNFEEMSSGYSYPPQWRAETIFETDNAEEMLDYMLQGGKGYFRFYFKNPQPNEILRGMIFFNDDNTLVLGLAVESEEHLPKYEAKLKNDFDSELIMLCNEVPPPSNSADYKSAIGYA